MSGEREGSEGAVGRRWRHLPLVAGLALAALAASVSPAAAGAARTPVVFFPGYSATVLQVHVDHQTTVKGCPASGTFQDGIPADVGTVFTQVCRDRLETRRFRRHSRLPVRKRFSLPPGVRVTIPDYGSVDSAPVYDSFYAALERAGYVADRDLVVAGYDFRLSPDLGGFMKRTKRLIVRTWRRNGRTPVRLVGHSNGPMYAQYLLTHVSDRWKRRHIQGFTDIAGNLPGQGILWSYAFTGVNIPTVFSLPTTAANARSSARLMAMSPATWMSAADPEVFGDREVIIRDRSSGRSYTPADAARLLRSPALRRAAPIARHYLGFIRFADRRHYPGVDVTVEKGAGLPTPVGIALPNLRAGNVLDPATARYFDSTGDGNQEFITNDAARVWRHMRCHRFRFHSNPGVAHLSLPADPGVVRRLLADLKRPRTHCP